MINQTSKKEVILNDAFTTWFNARYKELVASELLQKWQKVDTFCQIGIAITAAGSSVAGWQLWEQATMKVIWTTITRLISLAALGHKGFQVVEKVKVWSEARQAFTLLKNQLETLRFEAETSSEEDLKKVQNIYSEIRKTYTEQDGKTPNRDFWLSDALGNKLMRRIYESNERTNFDPELKLSKQRFMSAET